MDETESRAWLGLVRVIELLPPALDAQLQRDSGFTHFEFMVLSMLQFAPDSTLRMTALAQGTNAALGRLSHVCSRLERRGLVERFPCAADKRATNVRLTGAGRRDLLDAAPGHFGIARALVIDTLTREQLACLADITEALGRRLDPDSRIPPISEPLPAPPEPWVRRGQER
ncbi:MarR family winged helix-turn-helix transcriptional regulator [Microbacterium aurum]